VIEAKIDETAVRQKIAALATPDETVPYEKQAFHWLWARRERIQPQLITALGGENPAVVARCLELLHNMAVSPELTEALIRYPNGQTRDSRYKALVQLEKSAADPRVVRLLDRASTDPETANVPLARARWSWLGGHSDRAVQLLRPVLNKA